MKVLIAGGGTGGHVIPALAIARELLRVDGAEILFVGTGRGMETRLVPEAGFRLELIEAGQLKNVSLVTRLNTLIALPLGVAAARKLLKEFKPDVVIGVGGYASGPVMAATILDGVRRMVFEPNAYPGLANRLAGKWVNAAAVNFPEACPYFKNAEITGIPVREDFFLLPSKTDGARHLLVFGGSQGARAINQVMPQIAAQLLDAVPGLTVLHQTGPRGLDATRTAYTEHQTDLSRLEVKAFLDDMPSRFQAADLVLCRSGASTVAELAAAGKASLLVPFPEAADDHQRKNAQSLVSAGGARLLVEAEMTPMRLLTDLTELLSDRGALARMSGKAREQAHPDAVKRIVAMVREVARK